jgi:hypothetical protein
MAADIETALRALRIPRPLHDDATEIMRLTDGLCAEHLDAEYGELCRRLVARLARKRPTPLARGDLRTWAAAIIYTVGSINFLFDASQEPHLTGDQLCALTGVPKSTVANKSRRIRDLLGLRPVDLSLCRQQLLRDHPYAWLVEIDGLIVDARHLPPEIRAAAVRRGLIPDLDGGRA